jgi:hypothetical protein
MRDWATKKSEGRIDIDRVQRMTRRKCRGCLSLIDDDFRAKGPSKVLCGGGRGRTRLGMEMERSGERRTADGRGCWTPPPNYTIGITP